VTRYAHRLHRRINQRVARTLIFDRLERVLSCLRNVAKAPLLARFRRTAVQLFRHWDWRRASSRLPDSAGSDVKALDARGCAQDFTDLHAWCEVYLPGGMDWIGSDLGAVGGKGHIRCLHARPSAASPVSARSMNARPCSSITWVCGSLGAPTSQTVQRCEWGNESWPRGRSDLCGVGRALTMGREPTFVSVDDPTAPSGNTSALGLTKPGARRLYKAPEGALRPAGMAHFGRGKCTG